MSTHAFSYTYDAAGNRVKQVKDSVPTFYHYDAANELLMKHEDGTGSEFHFFEYDANGSMVHDSKVDLKTVKALLDVQFEDTTDGADGEEATESGTISYEDGELLGTRAVRVAGAEGTGEIEYDATGNLADGEGTILIRLKSDDWDDATHTRQVAIRLWKDDSNYIEIYLDTSAEKLHAVGYVGGAEDWDLELSTSAYEDGEWYCVTLAYETDDVELASSGNATTSVTASASIPTGLTKIYVGSEDGGTNPWYGLVDEVLTFDKELTSTTQLMERSGGASNTTYFEYADNGLTSRIVFRDGSEAQFHYDAHWQRFAVGIPAEGVAYFCWDGLNIVLEQDGQGVTQKSYTHGCARVVGIGTSVVAKDTVYGFQYPTYDHRGTVHELTDEAEAVCNNYEHSAFGEELERTETEVNRLSYQSNWYAIRSSDGKETYLIAPMRVYDSEQGRFVSRDFLWLLNRYRCFSNSPPTQVDPHGLQDAEPEPTEIRPESTYIRPDVKHRMESGEEVTGESAKDYHDRVRGSDKWPRLGGFPNRPIDSVTGKPGEKPPWYDSSKPDDAEISRATIAKQLYVLGIALHDKSGKRTHRESEACTISFTIRLKVAKEEAQGWVKWWMMMRGTWRVTHDGRVVRGPETIGWHREHSTMEATFGGGGLSGVEPTIWKTEAKEGMWKLTVAAYQTTLTKSRRITQTGRKR